MALSFHDGAYWDGDDGPLSERDVAAIRDRHVDRLEDELAGVAVSLLDIAPSQTATEFPKRKVRLFSDAFRERVANGITSAYTYAVGGPAAMTESGWAELTELVNKQDQYAQRFVESIRNGELSERQIVARARAYAGSGTTAFEAGKAAMRSFKPPELPGQLCAGRTRCRCFWEIVRVRATIEATWKAKGDASTCSHCAGNALRYNPLIVSAIEEAKRPDPEEERPGMGDLDVNDFYQDFTTNGPSTASKYLEPNGKGGVRFTADRQALHDEIIRDFTEGVPHSHNKTIYMLGGGGGAGKTTMIKSGAIDVPSTEDREAVLVNADEMKDQLPEYRAMQAAKDERGAAFAHEESSYLAKRLTKAAFENGQDIVLDGVGVNYLKTTTQAHANGYEVNGYYAFLPNPEDAVDRAIARFHKTGRMPPPEVIRSAHKKVAKVFPDAAMHVDSVVLYNTSTRDPVLVAHRNKGEAELTIDNQAEYDHFLSLGE